MSPFLNESSLIDKKKMHITEKATDTIRHNFFFKNENRHYVSYKSA